VFKRLAPLAAIFVRGARFTQFCSLQAVAGSGKCVHLAPFRSTGRSRSMLRMVNTNPSISAVDRTIYLISDTHRPELFPVATSIWRDRPHGLAGVPLDKVVNSLRILVPPCELGRR